MLSFFGKKPHAVFSLKNTHKSAWDGAFKGANAIRPPAPHELPSEIMILDGFDFQYISYSYILWLKLDELLSHLLTFPDYKNHFSLTFNFPLC